MKNKPNTGLQMGIDLRLPVYQLGTYSAAAKIPEVCVHDNIFEN